MADDRFQHKKPADADQEHLLHDIRNSYDSLYRYLDQSLKDSRYKSLAITELESSMQWAIKSEIFKV